MVVVSAGHVCGTRGLGIVSSAADVLGMRVVYWMRGACEMCMCLARGGVGGGGGEWMRGLGLRFTNPVRTGGDVGRMSVLRMRWCVWCRWGMSRGLVPGSGRGGRHSVGS